MPKKENKKQSVSLLCFDLTFFFSIFISILAVLTTSLLVFDLESVYLVVKIRNTLLDGIYSVIRLISLFTQQSSETSLS